MIQRPQTLWLLIAAILAFASLKLSFFSGDILVENVKQRQQYTGMSSLLLMILTVVVGVLPLVTIFLFKDRKLQTRLTMITFLLSVLNLVLYYLAAQNFVAGAWSYDLTGIPALTIPVFLVLAARGIYKDEKLIRSVDRLR